jgi:2-oxo-3-(phosphooxy)propyl 3-oxoalkanoate synthase
LTTLVVDCEDSFFYDHPLDHVPGMLIVSGLLDLVRAEAGAVAGATGASMSFNFYRFCENDDEIVLKSFQAVCDPHGQPTWKLSAEVGQRTVCDGHVSLIRKPGAENSVAAPVRPGESLLKPELVHRTRPENILVGEAWWDEGRLRARVQQPTQTHPLRDRVLEYFIEAARQFATLAGHVGYQKSLDSKYIMRGLEAELPLTHPPGEVLMEWRSEPTDGRSFDLRVRLHRPLRSGADQETGAIRFDALIVTPHKYRVIRARQRRAVDSAR